MNSQTENLYWNSGISKKIDFVDFFANFGSIPDIVQL